MSDLIDRQAAIDALKAMAVPRYKDPACEDIWERDRTLDNAISIMRDLPSAQRWIPVNERLPEYGEQVVVNFRNEQIGRNRIGVSYCYVQKEGFFSDAPFEYKVVAWMPLPDPWRGEDEN